MRALGTIAGLVLAYVHFARTFRGPRERFWIRMTTTGFTLGTLALASGEGERIKPRWRDIPLGILIAMGLFAIFQLGDRQARKVMPKGAAEIGDIYALRDVAPREEIALRLATVIGPAEELFWRGWLQRRIGWLPASAAYAGAHLVTRNVTLIGAAGVAGVYWGALAAIGAPMTALIVSHAVWDIWIFLVSPTERE
jgi:membrane protease YdiL (CAAX protease family)